MHLTTALFAIFPPLNQFFFNYHCINTYTLDSISLYYLFKMKVQYNPIDSVLSEKLDRIFQKKDCLILVDPGSVILPRQYPEIGNAILDLEVRKDDTWMVSYPRTGNVECLKIEQRLNVGLIHTQLGYVRIIIEA